MGFGRTTLRTVLLTGMPVSAVLFAGNAAIYTAADLPEPMLGMMAAMPLWAGSFCTAYASGIRLRRRGVLCGILASLSLTLIWYAGYCMYQSRLCMPCGLLPTLLSGIAGGLFGTHRETPVPRRRLHRLIGCKEQLCLLPLLLHRPPQKKQQQTGRACAHERGDGLSA